MIFELILLVLLAGILAQLAYHVGWHRGFSAAEAAYQKQRRQALTAEARMEIEAEIRAIDIATAALRTEE